MKMPKFNPIPGAKRTDPWVPAGHPQFQWHAGADVQAIWRKYGWVPPSELKDKPDQKSD